MNNFTIAKAPLFDFAASCKALNVPESCGIGRDQDGNILSLGPWKRGEFEPRVDIAGPGVLLAAALNSVFIVIGGSVAFGRVVWKWRKVKGRWEMHFPPADERQGMQKIFHNAFRTYLLATSDTQMLLMFATTLSFWLVQRCTISAYHYTIALNIGLVSCANFVMTTAFVTEYWKTPFTGGLRFLAMVVVSTIVGLVLSEQRKNRVENPEYLPPSSRKDSTILLPASCFLDTRFKDIYSGLSTSVREKIGYPMSRYQIWEFSIWILTVILLIAGFARTILQLRIDRGGKAKTYNSWKGFVMCLHKGVALALASILTIIVGYRVYQLRSWVDRSGWIKPGRIPNPEYDWRENGQVLPMIQLLMIAVFICNEYEFRFYSPTLKTSSPRSSSNVDDWQLPLQDVVPANDSTDYNNRGGFRNRPQTFQHDQ